MPMKSWKNKKARPAGKRLRKAERAAVTDEKHGALEYEKMAAMELHIGHKKDARVYKSHAKDERRHRREDKKIVTKDKVRR